MDSNQRLPPCQGDTLPTELRGQKRNGSISKKSLNSKQILTFRKIPPKFYHLILAKILYKISPRRQIPSKFYAKFHDLSKIRIKFNGANSRRGVNLRQIWRVFGAFAWMSQILQLLARTVHLVYSPRPASFRPACLAPPCAR